MHNSADNLKCQLKLDNLSCKKKTSQYEVIACYPHKPDAITEGLKFYKGFLYESTGGNEKEPPLSTLRRVELKTGNVLDEIPVNKMYFAEGLTIIRGKIYQLTLDSGIALVYDLNSMRKPAQQLPYDEDLKVCWGLTDDGKRLIISDGSERLFFVDPKSFKVIGTPISVHLNGETLELLNELEYIKDSIYACLRYSNLIARIDPSTGEVNDLIDLSAIRPTETASCIDCGPNGLAYDAESGHLFVTGKTWPKLYELCLTDKID